METIVVNKKRGNHKVTPEVNTKQVGNAFYINEEYEAEQERRRKAGLNGVHRMPPKDK